MQGRAVGAWLGHVLLFALAMLAWASGGLARPANVGLHRRQKYHKLVTSPQPYSAFHDVSTANAALSDRFMVKLRPKSSSSVQARAQKIVGKMRSKKLTVKLLQEFSVAWSGFSLQTDDVDEALSALEDEYEVLSIYPVVWLPAPDNKLTDINATALRGTYFVADASAATDGSSARLAAGSSKRMDGSGIKIGIIDTGVDYSNPALGGGFGPGYKVAYGRDFVGNAFRPGGVPVPDADPMDCAGHGTHVAGVIAGNWSGSPGPAGLTTQPSSGASDGVVSEPLFTYQGLAPGATLGAYRVFGCQGGTTSELVVAAMDQAAQDGMQIINLSLGDEGAWGGPVAEAANRLAGLGILVVAAAGNAGASGLFMQSSVASAAAATSVGAVQSYAAAMTNLTLRVSRPSASAVWPSASLTPPSADDSEGDGGGDSVLEIEVKAAFGDVATLLSALVQPSAAALAAGAAIDDSAAVADGCDVDQLGNMTGAVALLAAGGCSVRDKVANAAAQGALGVVLYGNDTPVEEVCRTPLLGAPGTWPSPSNPYDVPLLVISTASGRKLHAECLVPVQQTPPSPRPSVPPPAAPTYAQTPPFDQSYPPSIPTFPPPLVPSPPPLRPPSPPPPPPPLHSPPPPSPPSPSPPSLPRPPPSPSPPRAMPPPSPAPASPPPRPSSQLPPRPPPLPGSRTLSALPPPPPSPRPPTSRPPPSTKSSPAAAVPPPAYSPRPSSAVRSSLLDPPAASDGTDAAPPTEGYYGGASGATPGVASSSGAGGRGARGAGEATLTAAQPPGIQRRRLQQQQQQRVTGQRRRLIRLGKPPLLPLPPPQSPRSPHAPFMLPPEALRYEPDEPQGGSSIPTFRPTILGIAGSLASAFSSWGPSPDLRIRPSVVAPGGAILSTVPRNRTDGSKGSGFAYRSGTSQAAPYVAAAAAIYMQANMARQVTAAQVEAALVATAKPLFDVSPAAAAAATATGNTSLYSASLPASVARTGGGLVDVSALSANLIDISPAKLELGSALAGGANVSYNLDIVNRGSASLTFRLVHRAAAPLDASVLMTVDKRPAAAGANNSRRAIPTYGLHTAASLESGSGGLEAAVLVGFVNSRGKAADNLTLAAGARTKLRVTLQLSAGSAASSRPIIFSGYIVLEPIPSSASSDPAVQAAALQPSLSLPYLGSTVPLTSLPVLLPTMPGGMTDPHGVWWWDDAGSGYQTGLPLAAVPPAAPPPNSDDDDDTGGDDDYAEKGEDYDYHYASAPPSPPVQAPLFSYALSGSRASLPSLALFLQRQPTTQELLLYSESYGGARLGYVSLQQLGLRKPADGAPLVLSWRGTYYDISSKREVTVGPGDYFFVVRMTRTAAAVDSTVVDPSWLPLDLWRSPVFRLTRS